MKIRKLVCAVLALVLLTGCATKQAERKTTEMGQSIIGQMELPMTLNDVLDDISEVDLYHRMPDVQSYRQETVEDPEADTEQVRYYRDEDLVYVRYIGYGEDAFDYYTQSKSGEDLVVKYIDQDGERYGVSIEAEDYSFSADGLKKGRVPASYQVSIRRAEEDRLTEYAVYSMENDTVYLSQAQYYDAEGNVRWYGSYLNEGEIEEWDDIRYPLEPDIRVSPELTEAMRNGDYDHMEVMLGAHRLSFDSRNRWYLTGQFAFVCEQREQAEKLADAYQLDMFESDDGSYYVELCDVTAAIAENFLYQDEDIFGFAQDEFNDPFYRPVEMLEDGSITGIG
ncbi:MAG: hypothetical protein PUJ35_02545 [Ruminococcus bromii]|nr:hypothetical protein [Ruminococcus bromii]